MSVDEMVRDELAQWPPALDLGAARVAIEERVAARRRRRRKRGAVMAVAAALVVVAGVVAGVLARPAPDGQTVRAATAPPSPTSEPPAPTSAVPDPLAALGPCRSLVPTAFDPLEGWPEPPADQEPVEPGQVPDHHVDPPPESVPDTPCGLALLEATEPLVGEGWRRWDDNPFGESAVYEMASATGYGSAGVSLANAEGELLQVWVNVLGPDMRDREPFPEVARLNPGRPIDGLPPGWSGTSTVRTVEPNVGSGRITLGRVGTLSVLVSVEHGEPPGGDGVLPLSDDDLLALAVALATDGPVQPVP